MADVIKRLKFEWKPASPFKEHDPQAIGDHIEALRIALAVPVIKADVLVSDAANEASILHEMFDWDDSKAAHKHRLNTAASILRSLLARPVYAKKVDREPLMPHRAFVNVIDRPTDARGYITRVVALSDADKRAQLVQDGWDELGEWITKYSDLSEFHEVRTAIRKLLSKRAA